MIIITRKLTFNFLLREKFTDYNSQLNNFCAQSYVESYGKISNCDKVHNYTWYNKCKLLFHIMFSYRYRCYKIYFNICDDIDLESFCCDCLCTYDKSELYADTQSSASPKDELYRVN